MKIAISTFQGIVAAVFDYAEEITVFETKNGEILNRSIYDLKDPLILHCTVTLGKMKIKYLLCGTISNSAVRMLSQSNIIIVPGITGKTNNVIEYFLNGALNSPENLLPGFRRRKGKGGQCGKRQ